MSLCDHLMNEFLEAEKERLRPYQLDEISLGIGIMNAYRAAFEKVAELTGRPDILKRRAPYEYGEDAVKGRPKKIA